MALTAEFKASFTNFNAAVAGAETTLKNFGDGAENVGATLNRMVDNFSGRKLIQQATEIAKAIEDVGGVAMLTDQELQKWGPTFDAAIAKAEKIGVAVPEQWRAVSDAAKESTATWEHLGETITQAFENPIAAMKQFGATFESSIVEQFGAVGIAAAGAVSAFAAIGVGAFELADKAAEAGEKLRDLSIKTGLSVPAASELSNAMQVAGGDMDQMGNALFVLNKNIGENSDKLTAGLGKIGLTVDQLKAAGPDQYLQLIASGLEATADQSTRSAAAAEIFNARLAKEMLPTLGKLNEALALTADIRPWTDEETKAAEEFDMQLASIKVHAEALGISIGRDLIPPLLTVYDLVKPGVPWFVGLIEHTPGVAQVIWTVTKLGEAAAYADAALMVLRGQSPDFAAAYASIAGAATDAAEKQKAAMDKAADAAAKPAAKLQAWNDALGAWVAKNETANHDLTKNTALLDQVMHNLDASYKELHKDSTDQATAAKKESDFWAEYNSIGLNTVDTINKMSGATVEGIKWDLARGTSIEVVAKAYGVTKEQVAAVAAQETFLKSVQQATTTEFKGFVAVVPDLSEHLEHTDSVLHDLSSTENEFHDGIATTGETLSTVTIPLFSTLGKNVIPQATKALDEARDATASLSDEIDKGLSQALERLPGELTHAFASGNITQAFGSLATQFTDIVEKPILKSLSTVQQAAVSAGTAGAAGLGAKVGGNLGAIVGGTTASLGGAALAASSFGVAMTGAGVAGAVALSAATLGIGAAAIGVVMLIEHFTKLSQTIKDGRAVEAAWEQQFGGSQQMIDAVGAAYANLGKSGAEAQKDIAAVFSAENQGAPATVAAIQKINDALAASAKKTTDVATGVDAITSAAQTLGGTAPAALQPLIRTLEGMPGITDAEKSSLDGLLSTGTTDYAALTQTASNYGITLEQLGPKFQQADISKRADQIVKDFGDLTTAGADAGAVMDGMGKSISTLVDDALKYGSSLPTALKPIIDHLMAAGELTDDTGKKLTDISGITFDDSSDPLAQGIDKLTKAINDLVTLLSKDVPDAAATAADGITRSLTGIKVPPVHVGVVVDDPGNGGGAGATPEKHASGGYVGGGSFPGAPSGTDTTPAWLTPGELVLTQQQQAQLGAQSSGPSNITIEVPVVVDGREIAHVVTTYQSRDLQARRKLSAA